MTSPVRVRPCGDRAASVELGADISPGTLSRVLALKAALAPLAGVTALVPSYASLFVEYDPLRLSFEELCLAVEEAKPAAGEGPQGACVTVPVCYHPSLGPDLEELAAARGLPPARVAELHAAPTYLVYMLGFTPGFAFLGGLDPRLATPRLPRPRARVPAGSVGIAGEQTGMYAVSSPGGWRLIGRTPLRLFDPARPEPALLAAGARVRFEPIGIAAYRRLGGEP